MMASIRSPAATVSDSRIIAGKGGHKGLGSGRFSAVSLWGTTGAVIRLVPQFDRTAVRGLHNPGAAMAGALQILVSAALAALAFYLSSNGTIVQLLWPKISATDALSSPGAALIGLLAGAAAPDLYDKLQRAVE
jgi:hypothetical protein